MKPPSLNANIHAKSTTSELLESMTPAIGEPELREIMHMVVDRMLLTDKTNDIEMVEKNKPEITNKSEQTEQNTLNLAHTFNDDALKHDAHSNNRKREYEFRRTSRKSSKRIFMHNFKNCSSLEERNKFKLFFDSYIPAGIVTSLDSEFYYQVVKAELNTHEMTRKVQNFRSRHLRYIKSAEHTLTLRKSTNDTHPMYYLLLISKEGFEEWCNHNQNGMFDIIPGSLSDNASSNQIRFFATSNHRSSESDVTPVAAEHSASLRGTK